MDKKCLDCGESIKGRADKKFCSDQCRNNYNNRLNSDTNNYVRNVNNILRKNRRILSDINTTGMTKVHRDKLAKSGFDFTYYTNTWANKKGDTYRFCYDEGYLPIENEQYLLVKRKGYTAE
jgi:hypothetical protein